MVCGVFLVGWLAIFCVALGKFFGGLVWFDFFPCGVTQSAFLRAAFEVQDFFFLTLQIKLFPDIFLCELHMGFLPFPSGHFLFICLLSFSFSSLLSDQSSNGITSVNGIT